MNGFVFMLGECFACHKMFSFNPHRVPSMLDDKNVRQPICAECITKANTVRAARGLPDIVPHVDAYELMPEHEL